MRYKDDVFRLVVDLLGVIQKPKKMKLSHVKYILNIRTLKGLKLLSIFSSSDPSRKLLKEGALPTLNLLPVANTNRPSFVASGRRKLSASSNSSIHSPPTPKSSQNGVLHNTDPATTGNDRTIPVLVVAESPKPWTKRTVQEGDDVNQPSQRYKVRGKGGDRSNNMLGRKEHDPTSTRKKRRVDDNSQDQQHSPTHPSTALAYPSPTPPSPHRKAISSPTSAKSLSTPPPPSSTLSPFAVNYQSSIPHSSGFLKVKRQHQPNFYRHMPPPTLIASTSSTFSQDHINDTNNTNVEENGNWTQLSKQDYRRSMNTMHLKQSFSSSSVPIDSTDEEHSSKQQKHPSGLLFKKQNHHRSINYDHTKEPLMLFDEERTPQRRPGPHNHRDYRSIDKRVQSLPIHPPDGEQRFLQHAQHRHPHSYNVVYFKQNQSSLSPSSPPKTHSSGEQQETFWEHVEHQSNRRLVMRVSTTQRRNSSSSSVENLVNEDCDLIFPRQQQQQSSPELKNISRQTDGQNNSRDNSRLCSASSSVVRRNENEQSEVNNIYSRSYSGESGAHFRHHSGQTAAHSRIRLRNGEIENDIRHDSQESYDNSGGSGRFIDQLSSSYIYPYYQDPSVTTNNSIGNHRKQGNITRLCRQQTEDSCPRSLQVPRRRENMKSRQQQQKQAYHQPIVRQDVEIVNNVSPAKRKEIHQIENPSSNSIEADRLDKEFDDGASNSGKILDGDDDELMKIVISSPKSTKRMYCEAEQDYDLTIHLKVSNESKQNLNSKQRHLQRKQQQQLIGWESPEHSIGVTTNDSTLSPVILIKESPTTNSIEISPISPVYHYPC